jgi:hypothetical protein
MIKPRIRVRPAVMALFGLPFLLIGLAGIRTSLDTNSWASASGRVVVSRPSPANVKARGGRGTRRSHGREPIAPIAFSSKDPGTPRKRRADMLLLAHDIRL